MTTIHGFLVEHDETISELDTRARIFRHAQTGAELMSLENEDENKVFGIAFRTPPTDSTGIAHILEHSVLGGSRKYPLKEPFVQLLKGSLKTFLNAFTAADRTIYPVASQNLQDFYNLVDVYLDAVLHPLITPHHLQQEGWHYELEDMEDPLIFKGVVFNEMKGVYSSPDSLLYRFSQQALFPDTPYAYDSGGDPTIIPQLTYEQFKDFHNTYYHPSNALIFFYGDDDPSERLRLVDAVLSEFSEASVEGDVSLQLPFAAPTKSEDFYGVDAETDISKKGMVQVNWLLPEGDDPDLVMGLSILSYALVSTQASPLRKTLIDSGLGEDLTGGGLSTNLRQMTFSVGMKGIKPADAGQVQSLILDTLSQLAQDGIESDMLEAAYNTIDFSLRENNTGSFPRGLGIMLPALRMWGYERDPLAAIAFEKPLAAVRKQLDTNDDYFQEMIRTFLLGNPHRATVILTPDPELNQRQEAEERSRLESARSLMDQQALQSVIDTTRELRELQARPDAPEDLAKLPMLGLADLDTEIKTIPIEINTSHGGQILFHDLFTNGIVYLDLGFNLRTVSPDLLPYAKLLGQSLVEMGTEGEDFVKLSQRIGRKTGGIHPSTFLSSIRGEPDGAARLFLHGKATMAQSQDMLDIMRDVLLTVKLDNQERFRQIVLEAKAGKESSLIPSGHTVVDRRLRAAFSAMGWAQEQMGGVDYLFFLRDLSETVENDWPSVLAKLEEVRHLLINRTGMITNVTLDADNWVRFEPQLHTFLENLPSGSLRLFEWSPELDREHEGLAIPSQVNYVGKGDDLYALGYRLHGSINVITNFMRTGYLWDKVRVQGGAYGGFCRFNRHSGILSFLSYRDPNLRETVAVYDGAANHLHHIDISGGELTQSIIGAIGSLDAYQLPDAKGYTSLIRYMLGVTDQERQRVRDEVLGTTIADFHAFADLLDSVARSGRVVVLGDQDALNKANQTEAGWLRMQRVL